MAEDLLTIQRLRLDCTTSVHAQTDRMLDDLERTAKTALGPAMQSALDQAMPADWRQADSVIYVPRLEVTLEFDTSVDRDAIARVWGRVLAAEVLRSMARPDVLRFEDEPTRLAAFLADLVQGRAWNGGLWRDFDGLKPLDPSAAIRTVLLRNTSHGPETCFALRPADLHRCLTAVCRIDARRVVDAFLAVPPAYPVSTPLDHVAQAAVSQMRNLSLAARQSPHHFALALIATCPETVAPMQALGAARVGALAALVLDQFTADSADAAPQFPTEFSSQSGSPNADWRHALDPAEARVLSAAVAKAANQSEPVSAGHTLPERTTPFGGAFLLWPQIQALPWGPLFPGLEPNVICAVQQAVLARALGVAPAHLRNDPALAPLFVTAAEAPNALPRISAGQVAHVLRPWFVSEGVEETLWCKAGSMWCMTASTHGYWMEVTKQAPDSCTDTDQSQSATACADAEALALSLDDALVPWLAQLACKRLAYRLPGFADATVGFLRQNILPMGASVLLKEDDAIQVTLDHAPLGIMLNLTGLSRQRYDVAPGTVIQLAQGDH